MSRTEVTWRRGAGHENTAASARRRSGDDGGGGGEETHQPGYQSLPLRPKLRAHPHIATLGLTQRESCCDELPDHRFARAACDRSCVKS